MERTEFKTIKYFRAEQISKLENSSDEAKSVISKALPTDSIAVLLIVTNPAKIEKAVNITKEGFDKIRSLVTA